MDEHVTVGLYFLLFNHGLMLTRVPALLEKVLLSRVLEGAIRASGYQRMGLSYRHRGAMGNEVWIMAQSYLMDCGCGLA